MPEAQTQVDAPLKDEYFDVSDNLRHWNTLRFAELTVFMALTAGLINALYTAKGAQSYEASLLLKGAGIGATLIFNLLQERTMVWFHAFNRRAIELERSWDTANTASSRGHASGRATTRFVCCF